METQKVFYYSGTSARPVGVQVLVQADMLFVHAEDTREQLIAFPLAALTVNKTQSHFFIYLDPDGLRYLQFHQDHELRSLIPAQNSEGKSWYQKLLQQKLSLLLPLAVALAVALYFIVITAIPVLGTSMISREQEKVMGDRLHGMLLQQTLLSGSTIDSAKTQRLQAFADHIRLSDTYPIRVTLIRSDLVNAYALPGGQVVIYSGLLDKIPSPEALAALLAHESTHINERHSLQSLLRTAANSILVSIVFGDVSGISGAVAGNAQSLNGLNYSRKLEKEADEKGMALLYQNQISLKGMEDLMQSLQKEGDLPQPLSFLSSHPLTSERTLRAAAYARAHPQEPASDTTLRHLFKALH